MYFIVLNYRLHQRGWPRMGFGRMIGAVFSHFLVNHAEGIKEEFDEVQLAAFKRKLPKIFDPEQLTIIAAASSSQIPDVLGLSAKTFDDDSTA